MAIYDDLIRYFRLCMNMEDAEQKIISLQCSTRTMSYNFTGSRSQPRSESITEKNALALVQLRESHRSMFEEIKVLQKRILKEIDEEPDEKTRYVMWCIVISYGNMISAQKLSCLNKKKFYSIFDSYMERLKQS